VIPRRLSPKAEELLRRVEARESGSKNGRHSRRAWLTQIGLFRSRPLARWGRTRSTYCQPRSGDENTFTGQQDCTQCVGGFTGRWLFYIAWLGKRIKARFP
jgi:hypothetical protein